MPTGLVPAPFDKGVDCSRELDYNASLWYGGRGIQVTGSNNTVVNNRLAGLHMPQSTNDTPPIAMEISGDGHTVTSNIIGRDMAGNDIGVCGQGMLLQGTEHVGGRSTRLFTAAMVSSRPMTAPTSTRRS